MWLLGVWKIIKPLAPYILAVVAVVGAYAYIYDRGHDVGLQDGYSKAIKETVKVMDKIPKCPPVKPCDCPPQIDFDKIKSRNVSLNLKQEIRYIVDQDSTFRDELLQAIAAELDKRKMSRCR